MRHTLSVRLPHRCGILGVFVLLLSAEISLTASEQVPSGPADMIFVSPARRPIAALPKAPAHVPAAAEQVGPLTLEVVTRFDPLHGPSRAMRQSVSRTRDRIHLAASDGREWLFLRNPVDPRRISGMLIDHASGTIVVHEESDLRSHLGINGWADALLLGLDPEVVPQLQRRPQRRTITGYHFTKHVAPTGTSNPTDVWWNDDLALPGAFTLRDRSGVTRVSIDRIVRGVKAASLEMPAARFPSYKVVDLAEWLEVR